jgi:hypothetical protein
MTDIRHTATISFDGIEQSQRDDQLAIAIEEVKREVRAMLETAINEAWSKGMDYLCHDSGPTIQAAPGPNGLQITGSIRGGPVPYRSWANRSPWRVYSCPTDPALRRRRDEAAHLATLGETQPALPPRGEIPDAP